MEEAAVASALADLEGLGARGFDADSCDCIRALLERAPDLVDTPLPSSRNGADQLIVGITIQRPRHLAMGGRKAAFGERVRRRLELAHVEQVRVDPEFVERAP